MISDVYSVISEIIAIPFISLLSNSQSISSIVKTLLSVRMNKEYRLIYLEISNFMYYYSNASGKRKCAVYVLPDYKIIKLSFIRATQTSTS